MRGLSYSRWWAPVMRLLAVCGVAGFAWLVERFADGLADDIANALERYATAFVLAQGLVIATLVAALLGLKWLRLHLAGLRDGRRRRIEEMIVGCAQGTVAADMPAALRQWHGDAVYVAGRALNIIEGVSRDRVEDLLVASGMLPGLIADSQGPDPNRAIQAVALLGQMRDASARAAVERALSDPRPPVRTAACRATLARGSDESQLRVLHELQSLPAWQRMVLFHLIPLESTVLMGFLQEALESVDPGRQLVALEFALGRQCMLPLVCPDAVAASASVEVRIKFFRTLPYVQLEADLIETLRRGLTDSDWRVRSMAARACGGFRASALAPELRRMCLEAGNPVEVGHAARALTRTGGMSWEHLHPLMMSGADMVRRVTAEAVEKSMLAVPSAGGGSR